MGHYDAVEIDELGYNIFVPYTFVQSDDWEGLYYQGNLIAEGHSLNARDVLDALDFRYNTKEANPNWLEERGDLPKLLKDVKE